MTQGGKSSKKVFMLFLFLSIYPIVRSSFAIFGSDSRKISEIIIAINYYLMIFLGYAISLKRNFINLFDVIYSLIPFCLINLIIIIICKFLYSGEDATGYNYLLLSNCLLPLSFLVFNRNYKLHFYVGLVFSFLALVFASYANSRSYVLVSFLIIFLANFHSVNWQNKFKIFQTTLLIGVLFLFYKFNAASNVGEKFQFESLFSTFFKVISEGNLYLLWEWDGNSRQIIVADAFMNFNFSQWTFGKGITGTYDSFVERSVIEMGFLNELFRWGLSYLGVFILSFIVVYLNRSKLKSSQIRSLVLSLIFIRFVDGFIYGSSEGNLYNLLFFTVFFYFFNYNSKNVTLRKKNS
jgi:hypothetical protein